MRDRALSATLGSVVDVVLRQGAQLVVLALLARLLAPADFGLVAMATAVVVILSSVSDLGMTAAIIRLSEATPRLVSTAFWASVTLGSALSFVAFMAAPSLESSMDLVGLADVLRPMSAAVLLNSLGAAPNALLVRDLRFARIAVAGGVSTVTSGLVALSMALNNEGVMSLVAMTLVMSGTLTGAVWYLAKFRPRQSFSREDLKLLWSFGRYVVGTTLLDAAVSRLPLLVVGARYGAVSLGQYSRADSANLSFTEFANSVVGRVALPIFSQSAMDPKPLLTGLRNGLRFAMALNGPAMLLVAALGTPLTIGVFGDQWGEAGVLLSVLALGSVVWPIHVLSVNMLLAAGVAKEVFYLDVRKKLVLVAALIFGTSLGVVGIAWAVSISGLVAAAMNLRAVSRVVDYSASQQLADCLLLPAVSVPAATVVWLIGRSWDGPPLLVSAVLMASGILAVALLAVALRLQVVTEILRRMRQSVP